MKNEKITEKLKHTTQYNQPTVGEFKVVKDTRQEIIKMIHQGCSNFEIIDTLKVTWQQVEFYRVGVSKR